MFRINRNVRLSLALFCVLSVLFLLSFSCKKQTQAEMPPSEKISAGHEGHLEEEKQPEKKTLYRCPMHPQYTSDKPGECPICGMTLVKVEEEETMAAMEMPEGTVRISPEKQQLIGVTFARAEFRNLEKRIRTAARIAYDETRLKDINTKFPGWVERLDVDFTGQMVKKGQPLFSVYSPELVSAQEEYLLALRAEESFKSMIIPEEKVAGRSLVEAAKKRLILWDITEQQIQELEKSGKPTRNMVFYAPFTGFVIEKNILQGKYIVPGENLYRIADISRIWVLADIYEFELPLVAKGQKATISLPYFPGEDFVGEISYIYPYLESETRTVKVRIELPNQDVKLKPDMYGALTIILNLGEKLSLPASSVLDSGLRKLVFVDRGQGYFEPREVKLGVKAEEYYEVLAGVKQGERVVTSANFLIDSESKLKSAVKEPHKH